ncbi:hypothetical protein [Phenylobacterium aquaticum]|uniref:hypothetical protein n=1 Tax=Phenylobacterium aquaticum TaxID=1763816 RepID=UPI0026EF35BA|nr:hypothetical protein [Phenylobacterium aquaticum]
MSKPHNDLTARLLDLPVGKSAVASVRRPDAYLRTVRRHRPETRWQVESIDCRWVITRLA